MHEALAPVMSQGVKNQVVARNWKVASSILAIGFPPTNKMPERGTAVDYCVFTTLKKTRAEQPWCDG